MPFDLYYGQVKDIQDMAAQGATLNEIQEETNLALEDIVIALCTTLETEE